MVGFGEGVCRGWCRVKGGGGVFAVQEGACLATQDETRACFIKKCKMRINWLLQRQLIVKVYCCMSLRVVTVPGDTVGSLARRRGA